MVPALVRAIAWGPLWYHLPCSVPRQGDGSLPLLVPFELCPSPIRGFRNSLTRVGLTQSAINDAPVAFPPVEEQHAIAAFLDRETAKIEGAAQERIALSGARATTPSRASIRTPP